MHFGINLTFTGISSNMSGKPKRAGPLVAVRAETSLAEWDAP